MSIGRCEVDEIGGPPNPESRRLFHCSFDCSDAGLAEGFSPAESPDITGGGNSRPSLAFLASWRAKSDACHHSKNFSAKIEVGSRIFRLDKSRGYTVSVIVRGLKIDRVSPGRTPVPVETGLGCVASAMALLSAALSRRILVPMSQSHGEWYFDPSNR